MANHNGLGTGEIHRIYDQTYADTSARDADTDWNGVSTNVGKCVLVGADEIFMLTATTPTWAQLSVDESGELDTIYTANGTLTGNRTVTGYSSDDLTFAHYNDSDGTAYTLRSELALEDNDIRMSLFFGNGAGSDLAESKLELTNSGLVFTDAIGSEGIVYGADYSSGATSRWLTDKGYVDGLVVTAGEGMTKSGTDLDLGGTITADVSITADSDGDHAFAIGDSTTNRIDNFNVYTQNGLGGTAGSQNDRSFFQLFGDTLKGMQFGYFLNETSLMGMNVNIADDGNFEVVDAINSKGMIYAGDYSSNYTDRSIVDKAYADSTFEIQNHTFAADRSLFLSDNDWLIYKGSDTSNNILTIHGDGSHSTFDPFMTLHEGFATGNGTNSQALICNFGKAAQVQWNDGTRSVDVFHITGIVNGSETFTHMETSFQSTRHDYVEIDRWDWYFDTSGTTNQITVYEDDAGNNQIFSLDDSGNISAEGQGRFDGGISVNADVSAGRMIDVTGPSNADCEIEFESADNSQYDVILALDSENKWEFNSKHFSSGNNDGRFIIRNDTSGTDYMTFSDVNTNIVAEVDLEVDGTLSATSVDLKAAAYSSASAQGVNITTSEAQLNLDTTNISNSAYTLGTDQITFNEAGTYLISFNMEIVDDSTSGATRGEFHGYIKVDGSRTGFEYAEVHGYVREDSGGQGVAGTFMVPLTATDVVTFWGIMDSTTNVSQGDTHIHIIKVGA